MQYEYVCEGTCTEAISTREFLFPLEPPHNITKQQAFTKSIY